MTLAFLAEVRELLVVFTKNYRRAVSNSPR